MIPSQTPCSPTRPFSLCDPQLLHFHIIFSFCFSPHFCSSLSFTSSLHRSRHHSLACTTSLQVHPVRCGPSTAASALSHSLTLSVARAAETPPSLSFLRLPQQPTPPSLPPPLRKRRRPPARRACHPTYLTHLCAIPQSLAPPPKCLRPYRSPISNNKEPTACLTRLTPLYHRTPPGRQQPASCAPPALQVRFRFMGLECCSHYIC